MDNWRQMTASDLGRAIGTGQIDPVELCAAFLDAMDAHEQGDRIYARTTPDRARAEAEAARDRARSGLRRGLLDGVPISWKDLVDTAGTATEAGSALLAGRVPEVDADVLAIAADAGSVCLGKTHMTELAFSGLGVNPVTATPPNIHDPALAPGGSSSGAAASIAFGLAAGAIGSDTGGSVRVPAAWNDLVGLKTTVGRVPLHGVVPLCPQFDTIGPLARSVEDAAELLAMLEGRPAVDPITPNISGIRLAVLETVALDDIRDAPARAFEAAVDHLAAAGAQISRIKAPEVADALNLSGIVFPAEAYANWEDTIEAAPEKMFSEVRRRFRQGAEIRAVDYVRAWQTLVRCRHLWMERVEDFDAVLIPTSPILPPGTARLLSEPGYFERENLLTLRNTRIGNLLGLCALTLPSGVASAGVSLMGRPFEEEQLLHVALSVEQVLRG